jgi:hypothetical protein
MRLIRLHRHFGGQHAGRNNPTVEDEDEYKDDYEKP